MKESEASYLLSVLRVNYPGSFTHHSTDDTKVYLNLWRKSFENYSYNEVARAINRIIQTDTSNFAPSIGRVKDELNKKFKESVMPSEEAWSIVLNKASCNPIKARANFESLPGNIKKAVTHPKFLESLGYANANNRGTFKRDFVKNYNDIIENDYQEMNANAITRLEFCERNAIPGETIKALTGVTDLKQIESK